MPTPKPATPACAIPTGGTRESKANELEIEPDFQGGITLATSGAKNGLLAAIAIGLLDKPTATEILLLVREATERLIDDIQEQ